MLTFTTEEGNQVFVGQNAYENDKLTLSAKANDIWLHAEGFPGAHVVLKASIDAYNCIKFAKELALKYSKAINSKQVIVAYCGDVEKKRGSKPGEVFIRQRL